MQIFENVHHFYKWHNNECGTALKDLVVCAILRWEGYVCKVSKGGK
jgi:hypothetical protein